MYKAEKLNFDLSLSGIEIVYLNIVWMIFPKVLEYEIVHWKNWNIQYRFFYVPILITREIHVCEIYLFLTPNAKPIITLVFRRSMIFIKEVDGNENNPLKISSIVGQNSLWCYKCDITPVAKRGGSPWVCYFWDFFLKNWFLSDYVVPACPKYISGKLRSFSENFSKNHFSYHTFWKFSAQWST